MKLDKGWLVLFGCGLWLVYGFWIFDRNPKQPNIETGNIWPVPYHGSTAYVSLLEYVPLIAPPRARRDDCDLLPKEALTNSRVSWDTSCKPIRLDMRMI